MKTAIVYYSMLGNAKFVAEKIAKTLEADLIQIEPETAYPNKGIKKFFWGGKSAVMEEMPKLQPYEFKAEQYDRIIIGSPVWASNFTPPIRTFIHENKDIKQKQLSVFMCFSGGGANKAIDKMKKAIGIEHFQEELILIDPKDKKNPENDAKITAFCTALL